MEKLSTPAEGMNALAEQLDGIGLGISVRSVKPEGQAVWRAEAVLVRNDVQAPVELWFGPAVRMADLARADSPGHPVRFVFTELVPPATADAFRRAGIQYIDMAGNASINFGPVLVEVRGRSRAGGRVGRPPVTRSSLFSPASSKVVFVLLAWPELWRQPQRDVARAAAVSNGKAHEVLTTLKESGYGSESGLRAQHELLELWAASYPTNLAPKLVLETYRGPVDNLRPAGTDDLLYLSGEAAMADVLKPATLDLYVTELDPHLAVVNRWRTDGVPNVVVRKAFWREPGNTSTPSRPRPAPWPLVYADLRASTDPRVRTAAHEWKERHASVGSGR